MISSVPLHDLKFRRRRVLGHEKGEVNQLVARELLSNSYVKLIERSFFFKSIKTFFEPTWLIY